MVQGEAESRAGIPWKDGDIRMDMGVVRYGEDFRQGINVKYQMAGVNDARLINMKGVGWRV